MTALQSRFVLFSEIFLIRWNSISNIFCTRFRVFKSPKISSSKKLSAERVWLNCASHQICLNEVSVENADLTAPWSVSLWAPLEELEFPSASDPVQIAANQEYHAFGLPRHPFRLATLLVRHLGLFDRQLFQEVPLEHYWNENVRLVRQSSTGNWFLFLIKMGDFSLFFYCWWVSKNLHMDILAVPGTVCVHKDTAVTHSAAHFGFELDARCQWSHADPFEHFAFFCFLYLRHTNWFGFCNWLVPVGPFPLEPLLPSPLVFLLVVRREGESELCRLVPLFLLLKTARIPGIEPRCPHHLLHTSQNHLLQPDIVERFGSLHPIW